MVWAAMLERSDGVAKIARFGWGQMGAPCAVTFPSLSLYQIHFSDLQVIFSYNLPYPRVFSRDDCRGDMVLTFCLWLYSGQGSSDAVGEIGSGRFHPNQTSHWCGVGQGRRAADLRREDDLKNLDRAAIQQLAAANMGYLHIGCTAAGACWSNHLRHSRTMSDSFLSFPLLLYVRLILILLYGSVSISFWWLLTSHSPTHLIILSRSIIIYLFVSKARTAVFNLKCHIIAGIRSNN